MVTTIPVQGKSEFLNNQCKESKDSSTTSVREPPLKSRIFSDNITPADTKIVVYILVQIYLYDLISSPHLHFPYIFETYYFSTIVSTIYIRRSLVQQVPIYPTYLSSLLHLFRSYIICDMVTSVTSRQAPYLLETILVFLLQHVRNYPTSLKPHIYSRTEEASDKGPVQRGNYEFNLVISRSKYASRCPTC